MTRALLSTCLAVFLATAAFAQKVTYQYDRSLDFSLFKTYQWITIQSQPGISDITAQNIKTLVDEDLQRKGLARVPEGTKADLYVGYQTSISKESEVVWYNDGGPWMGGYGEATTSTIHVGTLVVDFYNPSQKQLVWRGSATKTIKPSGDPDKNYRNLQKAITKLLEKFPPKRKT